MPGWFVAPIFRRNVLVQTGICMILPENRCHRVPAAKVRLNSTSGSKGLPLLVVVEQSEEVDAMLNEAKVDREGFINYEDFIAFVMG